MIRIFGISGEIARFDASDVTLWEMSAMVKCKLGIPRSEQKYYRENEPLMKSMKIQGSVDLTMVRCEVNCAACGKYQKKRKYQVCGECMDASYCSERCQKEDWTLHKKSCIKHEHKYKKTFPNGMRDNTEYDLVCECGSVR